MELLHAFSTNSTVCSLTARTSPSYTAGGAIHAAWGRLHWARCWVTTLWFFNIFNIPNGLQYISCLHTWSFDFLVQQAAELFFHFRHKGLTLNSPHVYVYLFIYTLTVILAYNFFFIYIFKIPWNTDSFLWIYLHSDHFFFFLIWIIRYCCSQNSCIYFSYIIFGLSCSWMGKIHNHSLTHIHGFVPVSLKK